MIKQFLWIVTGSLKVVADTVLCILHWQVPVAHCFGPPGHYKRKFCTVCRKSLESPAFRCEGNYFCSCPCVTSNIHFVWHTLRVCVYTHTRTHCLRDFCGVYHPVIGRGNVYFRWRNNKAVTFNEAQTWSNVYALSSYLQFTWNESVVLMTCMESMPKTCKEWEAIMAKERLLLLR